MNPRVTGGREEVFLLVGSHQRGSDHLGSEEASLGSPEFGSELCDTVSLNLQELDM